jgi:hypothetical protein
MSFLKRLMILAVKKTEYFVWDEMESDGIAIGPSAKENVILQVLGFSKLGLRIAGQAPFEKFKFNWWSPNSGLIHTELEVVTQSKNYFEAKFVGSNPAIQREIKFWEKRYPKKVS